MDISETLAPKSDQLDAVDLLGSPPRVFTVTKVSKGSSEQPVNVHLAEFPRPWRPGLTMRRVLAHCWGRDASQWVGKKVELYCDADVTFGAEKVGGVRISRLSHIDKPLSVPIIVKRGRGGGYKVSPLPDAPTVPTISDEQARDLAALFTRKGIAPEQRVPGVAHIIGRGIAAITEITETELQTVADSLATLPDAGESA